MGRKNIHKVLSLTFILLAVPAFGWATNGENTGKDPKKDCKSSHIKEKQEDIAYYPEQSKTEIQETYAAPESKINASAKSSSVKSSTDKTLSHNYLFYLIYKFKYCNVFDEEETADLSHQ